MDLRCPHRKFGTIRKASTDHGLIEVSCPSRWCGRRPGVVVLHTFDTATGDLVATVKFKDPQQEEGPRTP